MALALIFLAVVLCLLAVCTKGSARILRYSGVTWKQGFAYAGALLTALLIARMVFSLLNIHFNGYSAIPVALLLQVAIGAWFFRERAFSDDGVVIGTEGAVKLSAVIFGFWLLAVLALFLLSSIVNP
jgi:hypothetical protein